MYFIVNNLQQLNNMSYRRLTIF